MLVGGVVGDTGEVDSYIVLVALRGVVGGGGGGRRRRRGEGGGGGRGESGSDGGIGGHVGGRGGQRGQGGGVHAVAVVACVCRGGVCVCKCQCVVCKGGMAWLCGCLCVLGVRNGSCGRTWSGDFELVRGKVRWGLCKVCLQRL